MRKRRTPAIGLLVAALFAACGASADAGAGPEANALCPPPDFAIGGAVDVAARCRQMVTVADERLGLLHWPVTDVNLRWSLCAPNMRCAAFVQLSQAWVIYRFSIGDPVMIHVGSRLEGNGVGGLVADAPEPLPAWLLEELQQEPRTS